MTTDAQVLEAYLHEHIPLSKAMGVVVLAAGTDGVRLSAPLEPNINHRETVFGGSATAVGILSAWALIHLRLRKENLARRLVIRRHAMRYDHPITGAFTAAAAVTDPAAWRRFVESLRRKDRGRINVVSHLRCEGRHVGEFEGDFVAMARRMP